MSKKSEEVKKDPEELLHGVQPEIIEVVEEKPIVLIIYIFRGDKKPCIEVPEGIRGSKLKAILKKEAAKIKAYKTIVIKDKKKSLTITIKQ